MALALWQHRGRHRQAWRSAHAIVVLWQASQNQKQPADRPNYQATTDRNAMRIALCKRRWPDQVGLFGLRAQLHQALLKNRF
jgi:hypothetical protein